MDQCSGKGELDAWQKAELHRLQWHLTNARSGFYSRPNVQIASATSHPKSGDLTLEGSMNLIHLMAAVLVFLR